MRNSFDLVAPFYDRLATCLFGGQWQKIQMAPTEKLQGKRQLLIVGGGSGKLLEGLTGAHSVTYVELSKKMIQRAQARKTNAEIKFVYADYLTWRADAKFDAILFPFFLDAFSLPNLQRVLIKAKGELKENGELHVIDFQRAGTFKGLLVKTMYWFFRFTAHLEGNRLLNFDDLVLKSDYSRGYVQHFFGGWIFYHIYGLG